MAHCLVENLLGLQIGTYEITAKTPGAFTLVGPAGLFERETYWLKERPFPPISVKVTSAHLIDQERFEVFMEVLGPAALPLLKKLL